MQHKIDHSKTLRHVHSNLVNVTVVLTCTCGARCRSRAGITGALSAYDKHVKRSAQ